MRRILRRPDIYAYVQDLGIDSSLIRPHYELPIDMVASSRKNKSRQGIESSHSNNVRSAFNMIPCFPTKGSTDVHHCDIVSSRSSPPHFTKDTPFNTSQVRTRSTTKKLNHENQKDIIWEIEIRGNAHAAIHLRTINQFLKLVYLRK